MSHCSGDESIKANIPKILECALVCQTAKDIDKKTVRLYTILGLKFTQKVVNQVWGWVG